MPDENIEYQLDQELVILTLTSLSRLFKLSPDAALLYIFYCKNAKIQANQINHKNAVRATRSFCEKGLGWGHEKYNRTKKILLDNNFIEDKDSRDEKGQVDGHYVIIHFLLKSHEAITGPPVLNRTGGPPVLKPTGGEQTTNSIIDKNRNSNIDKKLPPAEIMTKKEEKGAELSYSKEAYNTEQGPALCSYKDVYEIAGDMNVSLSEVKELYKTMVEHVRNGTWKWGKTTLKRSLPNWIKRGIASGEIHHMTDSERLVYESDSPEKIARRKALFENIEEEVSHE